MVKCSMIPFPSASSWARNPAAANMARRPFCNSLVCMMASSSGSDGLRPSGSNPMSPGVYSARSRPGWSTGTFSGSTHPISARLVSAAPMATVRAIQNPAGTWARWVMAGPEIWASKRKEDPSTFSPTRNPTTASMATRPWVSSASRYRLRVLASAFSANPSGSKNPTGARAPGRSPAVACMAVEEAEDDVWIGAKAAADPAMAVMRAAVNFILIEFELLSC
mmetsp:Transcript_11625/g.33461  ORF Transcript_11625/g.33461 Transcript_11625/m.33461 type:complete len:222 (-) Transcript_11625:135-800(-)